MEYKNKLNQIKALLSLEVKLAQMTLADGITVVEAEEFEPEYSVGIVTPDGIVPMPVGEYELQDGSMVVVEVEGIIASVGPKAEEAPEVEAAPEEVVEPEMEAAPSASATPQPKRIVESVSKESFFDSQVVAELQAAFDVLKAEHEALKLAAQAKEEAIELASQEEGAEPLAFNPESAIKPEGFKYGKNRSKNIQDSVNNKLFN
jgi:hypothetical protein